MTEKNNNSDSEYPLVSIIVITYNSSKYVLETLESAKAQTYQNIELIISDDASTDDTVEVCRKWVEENKGRFVRTEIITVPENTGIPANCNRGVKAAQGEWVKLIAGDDVLLPEMISFLLGFIYSNQEKNIQIIHGEMNVYKNNFLPENFLRKTDFSALRQHQKSISAKEQYEIFLRRGVINVPAMIVRKDVFEKTGFFDETYTLYEDTPFILKSLEKDIKLYYTNTPLVNYRKAENSVQIKKTKEKQLIPDYQLQRDQHTLKHIIPKLPQKERLLRNYLIQFRALFVRLGLNRRSLINKAILYFFTNFANSLVKRIEKQYC